MAHRLAALGAAARGTLDVQWVSLSCPSRAVSICGRLQLTLGATGRRGEDKAKSVPTWGLQAQQRQRPLSSDVLQTVWRCRRGLCALGLAWAGTATASNVGEAGVAHRLAGQQAAARGALDVQWVLLAPQVEQCLSADGCSLHYRRDKPPWRRRGKVCPHVGPAGAAVTPGSAERCSPIGMSLSLRSLCPRSALCTHGGRIQCRRGWSGPQAGCPRGSGAWDIGCAVGFAFPPKSSSAYRQTAAARTRRDKPLWRRQSKVCPHVGPAGAAATAASVVRRAADGMSLSLGTL